MFFKKQNVLCSLFSTRSIFKYIDVWGWNVILFQLLVIVVDCFCFFNLHQSEVEIQSIRIFCRLLQVLYAVSIGSLVFPEVLFVDDQEPKHPLFLRIH